MPGHRRFNDTSPRKLHINVDRSSAQLSPGSSLRPLDQPDNGNQDDRAYGCGDDRSDQRANRNAKDAEQPTADFGADNANDDVANGAESAMHNSPGEPAGNSTDQKKDDQTRKRHLMPPDGAILDGPPVP